MKICIPRQSLTSNSTFMSGWPYRVQNLYRLYSPRRSFRHSKTTIVEVRLQNHRRKMLNLSHFWMSKVWKHLSGPIKKAIMSFWRLLQLFWFKRAKTITLIWWRIIWGLHARIIYSFLVWSKTFKIFYFKQLPARACSSILVFWPSWST